MSPRPYRLGRRQGAIEKTRKRVLRAARDLLAVRGGADRFSIDAVEYQKRLPTDELQCLTGAAKGEFMPRLAYELAGELADRRLSAACARMTSAARCWTESWASRQRPRPCRWPTGSEPSTGRAFISGLLSFRFENAVRSSNLVRQSYRISG